MPLHCQKKKKNQKKRNIKSQKIDKRKRKMLVSKHTITECTKVTTNNWDIRPSVTVKALLANISWMAKQIHMIELVLESAYQIVSNDI